MVSLKATVATVRAHSTWGKVVCVGVGVGVGAYVCVCVFICVSNSSYLGHGCVCVTGGEKER